MAKKLRIAIDGPVASGKGDIAARLAKKFNLTYVYTGAMYRMLALACIEKKISFQDVFSVISCMEGISLVLKPPVKNGGFSYSAWLNGKDVTERITHQDTAMGASDVSTIPQVRSYMVAKQKEYITSGRVVMEGRDIALRVMPEADLKIFLTASLAERAKRRFLDWQKKGIGKSYEETLKDTKLRDEQDTNRSADPLTKTEDAWELDTTGISQEEVVEKISRELRRRKNI